MVKVITILLFPLLLHASSPDRAQKFFLDHYEAAEQLYFCDGIPIQLSLGVWALESGYGTSTAAQRNNLAGIASYTGGKHWKRFATKYDFYASFAAIFQQPCYRNDLRPKSVDEYLEAMEWGCCSYHRSREYTHKIKWIIKRYKLDEMRKEVNDPRAEQEANKKGFEIGNTIVHKKDLSFIGDIIGFLYDYESVLCVIIHYNGDSKSKDSYRLGSWNKLILQKTPQHTHKPQPR